MSTSVIEAQKREATGTGSARAIRRQGNVPAIIYGGKEKEIKISLEAKRLVTELNKSGFYSRILDFKIGNETVKVIPKSIQLHPVTDQPEHADFIRVVKGQKVKVLIKGDFKNPEKSPGIKRGGILNIIRREIEVLCDADKIPSSIEVDLTGLSIGDSIHINDLILPEGVEPAIKNRNFTVATIVGRITEEQELARDAARAAVIAANQAADAAVDATKTGEAAPAAAKAGEAAPAAAKAGEAAKEAPKKEAAPKK